MKHHEDMYYFIFGYPPLPPSPKLRLLVKVREVRLQPYMGLEGLSCSDVSSQLMYYNATNVAMVSGIQFFML